MQKAACRKGGLLKKGTIIVAAAVALLLMPLLVLVDKALFWRSELISISEQASRTSPEPGCTPRNIMFIGDSIFAGFPLKAMFPQSLTVINRGVSGNSIRQIADRYKTEVVSTSHDIVVIEGGINDILGCIIKGKSEEETARSIITAYRETVSAARSGGKKAVVCSILPVTHKFLLPYSRAIALPTEFDVNRVNSLVRLVNGRLLKVAADYQASYCDLYGAVVDSNGEFQRSFAAADGYHVNGSGYKAISDTLMQYLVGQPERMGLFPVVR